MIKPKCFICKKELKEFGGLLIGPPEHDGKVDKKQLAPKPGHDQKAVFSSSHILCLEKGNQNG